MPKLPPSIVSSYVGSEREAVLNNPEAQSVRTHSIEDEKAAETILDQVRLDLMSLYGRCRRLKINGADLGSALETWMTGAMLERLSENPSAQVDRSLLNAYRSARPELSACMSYYIADTQSNKRNNSSGIPTERGLLDEMWYAYDRSTEASGFFEQREDVMRADLDPDKLKYSEAADQRFVDAVKARMRPEGLSAHGESATRATETRH